ncbi:MAG: hypothetical protein ACK5KP_01635 [Paludibacteraceae bacterium]
MTVDDLWDVDTAWKISFPVAFILFFYVCFMYRRMFAWYLILSAGYLFMGIVTTLVPTSHIILYFVDELIFLFFVVSMFLRKKSLERIAFKTLPSEVSISNNVNELFRVMRVILVAISVYMIMSLVLDMGTFPNKTILQLDIKLIYLYSIVFLIVFETIRVLLVRTRLANEDWLAVVDEQGNITGSVHYQPDVVNAERLIHPVVRLYFIDNGKIFLRRREANDTSEPLLWDAALSRTVRMTESVETILRKFSQMFYLITPEKFLFLTNYIFRTKLSDEFIYLFVSCKDDVLKPLSNDGNTTKWWTLKQITAEIGGGIFTERFEKEFEILDRSGLLERDGCNCECPLKEMIKNNLAKNLS